MKNSRIDTYFNFLATLSRSFDSHHVNKNMIHLVTTGLYSNTRLDFSDWQKTENSTNSIKNRKTLIIRVYNSTDRDICEDFVEISNNIAMCKFSVGYIASALENENKFEDILFYIFGDQFEKQKKVKTISVYDQELNLSTEKQFSEFNSVFIVFERLHWYNIQHIFNMLNVIISGGSISKRHLLSISEVYLMQYLIFLNFN